MDEIFETEWFNKNMIVKNLDDLKRIPRGMLMTAAGWQEDPCGAFSILYDRFFHGIYGGHNKNGHFIRDATLFILGDSTEQQNKNIIYLPENEAYYSGGNLIYHILIPEQKAR